MPEDTPPPPADRRRRRLMGWGVAVGVLLLTALLVQAYRSGRGQIAWLHGVPQALDEARAQGRPLLVYFGADWCPPCRRMRAEALADPDIAELITRRYVPVKVDLTQPDQQAKQAARRYRVGSIPTLIVVGSDGEPRTRHEGYGGPGPLRAWLERSAAVDASRQTALR